MAEHGRDDGPGPMTGLASQLAERPPWLVRFPHPRGESVAGAGVLVGPRHVLTCGHVLEKQLGRPLPAPGPGLSSHVDEVEVEFPFAGEPGIAGKRMRGTLVGWVPIPADRSGDEALLEAANDSGDVALLELKSPVDFTPAPLACPPALDGHRFSVHGFPDGDPVARQANGVLRGASGKEGTWVQLDKESATGWAIEMGFSGAPVFDHNREAVVGIVVVRDKRETRTGHMLPMSYLRTLWPEVRSNCRWRLDLEPSYDAHWGPRARGSEPDSPTWKWFFTGRIEARRVIRDWLKGSEPAHAKQPILLVTGGPGSGKSALLAHSLVSADPLLAETVPYTDLTDPRPPIGAFDVALHLRGQTCDEVTSQLALALDVDGSESSKLLAAVRKYPDGERITVLADAVEEAATLEEAQKIAALLRQLTNTGRVRVLAAVRTAPAGTTRARILTRLGRDAHLIDLEDSQFLHRPDITEYVISRLTSEQADAAQYHAYEPSQLSAIGEAVARKARYNFLIAQLTTGWLIRRGEQGPSPGEPSWENQLPTTVGDAMDAYLDTCGVDTPKLRRLLTALAYARGDGLPLGDTWLRMADALGRGVRHRAEDQEMIFESAAHYLVERINASSKTQAYRLYHDALDQHLREECERVAPEADITAALMEAVPVCNGERNWAEADAYTCDYLASHATAAGQLDDLLTSDTEYLVHATPRGLTRYLDRVRSEPARLAAAVYRTSLRVHATSTPGVRRQALALDAARAGATSLKCRLVNHIPAGDWAPLWATGSDFTPALRDTLTSQTGPVSHVTCIVLDGTPVAIAIAAESIFNFGSDCTAETWDLTTGAPLTRRTIPKCRAVCTLPDGTPVAVTMGYDKTVRVWNLITGTPLGKPIVSHTDTILAACTVVNGTPVVVIAYGEDSEQSKQRWNVGSAVMAAPSYDRSMLQGRPNVYGGDTVQAWNLTTGTPFGEPLADNTRVRRITCAVLEGAPVVLADVSDHRRMKAWDLATGTPISQPFSGRMGHISQIRDAAITVLNGTPVVVTAGSTLWVRSLAADTQLDQPLGSHTQEVRAVACAMVEGTPVVIAGGHENAVRVWDLATGTQRGEPLTGHTEQVNSVACAVVEGIPVAVTGSNDGTVRVWNLTTGASLGKPRPGHTGQVTAAACTAMGGTPAAATVGEDGTVRVWDLSTGTSLGEPFSSHTRRVFDIACTTAGGTSLAITGGYDHSHRNHWGTARVWDLATGAPVGSRQFDGDRVRAVAWIGDTPVCMGDQMLGGVRAWNLATSRLFGESLKHHSRNMNAVTCSVLAGIPVALTSDEKFVEAWNLDTGECVGRALLRDPGPVFSMACAVVDRTLVAVTGSTKGTVRIWNLATGTPLSSPLAGHTGWVDAVVCTVLDGTPVAVTAGRDDTVRVWDLRTGEPAGLLPVPRPRAVTPTPDGDLVVCMGNDVAVFRRRPAHTGSVLAARRP
ncbi:MULTISPECIES: trypsin-like peptidase domain-containing protein [unclassified Streptomyces]|uniref:trypsin-like peptidase domain-containing protein n=1 Tax=unclassified Streptomyces TaxID=2593676 RepID=UPI0036E948AF